MDERTRQEIDKVAWTTLRDAGITRPPVSAEALLDHLNLYRDFYDLQNPGFLDKAKHKIEVHGRRLVEIIRKISLKAVLFQDEGRIVLDAGLPRLKQEWPTMHEAAHRILIWHKAYFAYGDTAETLDPEWHERLEAEANYGASALMFCGPVFETEAKDTSPEWESVKALKGRYRKSYTTTLRRYVEHGPDTAMAMLVCTPAWKEVPSDQDGRCRYFVPSPKFASRFPDAAADEIIDAIDTHSSRRRGGLVADFLFGLRDRNGVLHEFRAEAFFNTYYFEALIVWKRRMGVTRVAIS